MGLLAGVWNAVKGAGENLWSAAGFGDAKHSYDKNIANFVTNMGAIEKDRLWQSSLGYAFNVVRVDDNGAVKDDPNWKEFTFQINPQDITQDEIFAIQVTPTFAGVMVEHQGITLKDILISGTTGISPGRREGGAYPNTGAPVAGSGRSGYYEFQELRSYIRTYAEAKRNDKDGKTSELRLVWRNFKDKEDLFVEPQKFTMRRSSAKPMSYDYSIQLKAIGVANLGEKNGEWYEKIDKAIQGVQDTLDSAVKVLEGSVGLLEQIDRDIRNTVIGPLKTIQSFVETFKNAGFRLHTLSPGSKISKAYCQKTIDAIQKTYDNAADYNSGALTDTYNAIKGRVKTLSVEEYGNQIEGAGAAFGAKYTWKKTDRALVKANMAMYHLKSVNQAFDSTVQDSSDTTRDLYNGGDTNDIRSANVDQKLSLQNQTTQALLAGDIKGAATLQSQLDNVIKSESKKRVSTNNVTLLNAKYSTTKIVEAGHTIQTLALFHLNRVDGYRDLILINNLIYPYVSPVVVAEVDKVVGVLYPGDKIYIPQSGTPSVPINTGSPTGYPITYGQDPVELKYGVDLKLTEDFDIALDVTGDAKLISGQSNVAQALLLRLLYEKGSLKRHPAIGTHVGVGIKGTNAKQILAEIRQSLLTDPRLDAILYSDITQESSALVMNFILRLIGADQPVAFPVRLQE